MRTSVVVAFLTIGILGVLQGTPASFAQTNLDLEAQNAGSDAEASQRAVVETLAANTALHRVNAECGANCVAAVLLTGRKECDFRDLVKELGVSAEGTSMDSMMEYLDSRGYSVKAVRLAFRDIVEFVLEDGGSSAIVNFTSGKRHWSLVKRSPVEGCYEFFDFPHCLTFQVNDLPPEAAHAYPVLLVSTRNINWRLWGRRMTVNASLSVGALIALLLMKRMLENNRTKRESLAGEVR